MKTQLVSQIALLIPSQPEELIPQFLATALEWGLGSTDDPASSCMAECGLIVLRALAKHPRLELRLPPLLAPTMVATAGVRAVPCLAALAPVLVRTPSLALDARAKEAITHSITEHLARARGPEVPFSVAGISSLTPIAHGYSWSVSQRRDLGSAVAIAHWATEGEAAAVDKMLVSVFICLCGGSQQAPGPALGFLVGSLSPAFAVGLPALLEAWPKTEAGDEALTRCVEQMATWPLALDPLPEAQATAGWEGGELQVPFTASWVESFLLSLVAARRDSALVAAVPTAAAAVAAQLHGARAAQLPVIQSRVVGL